MSLGSGPEFTQVCAPMARAMGHASPLAAGDVPVRRALWAAHDPSGAGWST